MKQFSTELFILHLDIFGFITHINNQMPKWRDIDIMKYFKVSFLLVLLMLTLNFTMVFNSNVSHGESNEENIPAKKANLFDGNEILNTSMLKSIGENNDGGETYVFPSYEYLLEAVPFKAQLPLYVPIVGGNAHLWVPHIIVANADLTEVSLSLSKEFHEDAVTDGQGFLYIEIANYKGVAWDTPENKKGIKIDDNTQGYFIYDNSDSNYLDMRFSRDGVYYFIKYDSVKKTIAEREKELIKIANSMVDYDKWYDLKYGEKKK